MSTVELKENIVPTILAVDDDKITRMTIKKVLEKKGYNVSDVESGEQAVEYCKKEGLPDIVLLDLMMPGMDGFETCIKLRELENSNLLPVIMLTGMDDVESIEQSFQAGSTDFISKPLNWPILIQRVKYALRSRAMYQSLCSSELQLKHAQSIAKLGYWEFDTDINMFTLSEESAYLFDKPADQIIPITEMLLTVNDEDQKEFSNLIHGIIESHENASIEYKITLDSGIERIIHQQSEFSENDANGKIIGTFQDITKRVRAEEIIQYQKYYDSETGLPNKDMFIESLSKHIKKSSDSNLTAILSLSLDRKDKITTTYGQSTIDIMLIETAGRINNIYDKSSTIHRTGNNIISLYLYDIHSLNELDSIANQVQGIIDSPYFIKDTEFHSPASIGITIFPLDDAPANELLNNSISAMHTAIKNGGKQHAYYASEMNEQAQNILELENKMRKGITDNEFFAFYQPQIDAATGKVIGMESLMRWKSNDKMIFPDEFIPVAEDTGLIIELGNDILFEACQFTSEYLKKTGTALRVAVNLSAKQFSQESLLDIILSTLEKTGLPPQLLDVEITESIAMTNFDDAVKTLNSLRSIGITTSMDDFGTGYSSLSYLQKLPLDILKIDRAFIKDIGPNGENSEIAKAIVAMAKSLGLNIIAEGVEEDYQYQLLRDLGCDEIQGFFFSKPLPNNDFETYVHTNHSGQEKKRKLI